MGKQGPEQIQLVRFRAHEVPRGGFIPPSCICWSNRVLTPYVASRLTSPISLGMAVALLTFGAGSALLPALLLRCTRQARSVSAFWWLHRRSLWIQE